MPTKTLRITSREIVNLSDDMPLVAGTPYLVSATVLALVADVADGEEFPAGGHPILPGHDLEIEAQAGSTIQARGTVPRWPRRRDGGGLMIRGANRGRGDGGAAAPVLYLWGHGQDVRIPNPAADRQTLRAGGNVRFKFLPLPQERFFGATNALVEVLAADDISSEIDALQTETAAHRDRSVIGLPTGLWTLRFWGASALSGETSASGQIRRVNAETDDLIVTTNLGYGTPAGNADASGVAMVLPMEVEEFEVVSPEQFTFLALGLGTGGDSWSCFLRLEKLA